MYKIFIVEDDITIAQSVRKHLEKWDYSVCVAQDFHNVMEEFVAFGPELVLLDILLPFYNGYHWCTEIRRNSRVPILFLSSASDNMNIVMAMNMGGDDFVEKPFDLNVLTAKIQALLRRTYSFQGQVNLLERNGAFLNLSDATLTYKNEKIELTKNDFKILKVLMENAGKIVKREELMQRLWESDTFIDDNTLTVNITRIRKKLEEADLRDFIKTKKGIGYLIE
ncbi:response regulator transcription factor [Mediterraneibacter sp. NSJ-55]|uniref:Stage 0 sporulation protein A homolog n=1 Tax=Mediterraneibacter hominis TaxID=2763054 RepID=A0A923RQQ2_9FIRM|nr:response regulator transcription factor [Mediterraneibacter hominis]MBC5687587.1 response regulator transcription factor [Mediterraneibacter hominis]